MTPGARIQGAIDLLIAMDEASAPADRASAAFFRSRRYIGAKDRRDILDHVYACLRARARLLWHISSNKVSARSLIIAKFLLIDGWTADRLAGVFDGGQYRPARLSDEERKLVQDLAGRPLSPSDQPDGIRQEIPFWLFDKLKAAFADGDWAAETEIMKAEAPLDLRVNRLKMTRADALRLLTDQGIDATETPMSPLGLRLRNRINLPRLDLFANGSVEVQDEGSQIIALLLGAKPGERIVDFCAGAGGKTLAIAAEMQNKGKIVATDTLAGRLERSSTRLNRAGAYNVERQPLSSETDIWIKRHKEDFDAVLVDAPCSGTGTWRRNPDQKWHLHQDDLANLITLQKRILASASRLVRPGGRLLYATCSLLSEENQDHIPGFLKTHPDFELVSLDQAWADHCGIPWPSTHKWLRLTPARHGCDGFFAALFKRAQFKIKPAAKKDARAIAELHEAGWRLAYGHFMQETSLAEMSAENRQAFWELVIEKGKDLLLAAFDRETLVGFLHGGEVKGHHLINGSIEGYNHEVYSLHCAEKYQGKGLGRQMLRHSANAFAKQGANRMMLWAFRDNPFRGFYEKCGGVKIAEGRDDGFPDIAYGWPEKGVAYAA